MAKLNLLNKIFNAGPIILLYYLSISEVNINLEKLLDILTFNLPVIIIFFLDLEKTFSNGNRAYLCCRVI